jgi:hypothetical protein
MAVVEAALAVVGLLTLLALAVGWYLPDDPTPEPESDREPSPEADLAAPYREGLHAAVRIQVAAQDLEQQLYAEAVRQAEAERGQEP